MSRERVIFRRVYGNSNKKGKKCIKPGCKNEIEWTVSRNSDGPPIHCCGDDNHRKLAEKEMS
jgi:hypothetical protein